MLPDYGTVCAAVFGCCDGWDCLKFTQVVVVKFITFIKAKISQIINMFIILECDPLIVLLIQLLLSNR